MKNHISLFIFAIALLSGPVSANDLSMTAVKMTPWLPYRENIITFMYEHHLERMKKKTMMK